MASLSQVRIRDEGWFWGLPGAGPCSQAVVVAVRNDITVAGENFDMKGGSGDCLGPTRFRNKCVGGV